MHSMPAMQCLRQRESVSNVHIQHIAVPDDGSRTKVFRSIPGIRCWRQQGPGSRFTISYEFKDSDVVCYMLPRQWDLVSGSLCSIYFWKIFILQDLLVPLVYDVLSSRDLIRGSFGSRLFFGKIKCHKIFRHVQSMPGIRSHRQWGPGLRFIWFEISYESKDPNVIRGPLEVKASY